MHICSICAGICRIISCDYFQIALSLTLFVEYLGSFPSSQGSEITQKKMVATEQELEGADVCSKTVLIRHDRKVVHMIS